MLRKHPIIQKLIYKCSQSQQSIHSILQTRDALFQYSSETLKLSIQHFKTLNHHKTKQSFYCGFDPTGPSLHLGNLLTLVQQIRIQQQGFKSLYVVGGATGRIGDPSGKKTARLMLDDQQLHQNIQLITQNISVLDQNINQFLYKHNIHTGHADSQIINNMDFYQNMNLIDFYRDVGSMMRMNTMLAKDCVSQRLENTNEGLSYTEFSYMILQAYDFYQLNQKFNCVLQIGGSDQWGNMTTGIELIKKINQQKVFVVTVPLLVNPDGQKFGKSEGNAIWLDQNYTTKYDLVQYLLNLQDQQVQQLLKMFTFLDLAEIDQLMLTHNQKPEKRIAQKVLAEQLTQMIYGTSEQTSEQGLFSEQKVFFDTDFQQLLKKNDTQHTQQLFSSIDQANILEIKKEEIQSKVVDGRIKIADLLVLDPKLGKSKKELNNLVQQGGVYLNGIQAKQMEGYDKQTVDIEVLKIQWIVGQYMVLRIGKKNYKLISLI